MPSARYLIRFLLVLLALCLPLAAGAQHTPVTGTVTDAETHQPLIGATVRLIVPTKTSSTTAQTAVTDANGTFSLRANEGAQVDISYLGYTRRRFKLVKDGRYELKTSATQLGEVYVTATESKSLTSASNISKHAMEHLQPSSFTDVLELLPGGMARDPSLSTPNTIHLREVPISSSDYSTSSLGTAFVIDGARLSTNANMQSLAGAYDNTSTSRDFTNEGVDMRSISTDDIENVEVVRGIPSVEYGDLTSGLVKINRRRGGHDLSARFKADMDTKLFYLAKGLEWKPRRLSLNLSADWLSNRADPRDLLETYTRLTVSARLYKQWLMERFTTDLAVNADYGGSFDRSKVDPELNHGGVDRYKSGYNHFATDFTLTLKARRDRSWLRTVTVNASASADHNVLERTRLVQLDRETPAATTTTTGESYATFIRPYTYTGTQRVDGLPFSAFAKIQTDLAVPGMTRGSLKLKLGADWQMDKNYGDGQVFDPLHPLYPGTSARQRTFRSIPASHLTGLYAETSAAAPLGPLRLDVQAGVRMEAMLNLPGSYYLSARPYADPRLNAGLNLPALEVGGRDLLIRLGGGIGQHTKFPTLDQLFPDPAYLDLVELNYTHENRDYRTLYLQTYAIDPTNRELRPARNLKWEVSLDANWWGNRMTLTYFKENMTSGFRTMAVYAPYAYRVFDTSGVDANTVTGPLDVTTLPYKNLTTLRAYGQTGNGSQTLKRGVELTLSTRRFPVVNTRVTVTGAWFKSEYRNSQNVQQRPSDVVGGTQVNVVGIYRDDDGYIREMYNTNFTFDTDIPSLKLGFSLSAQCVWLTASQSMPKANTPVEYMDAQGNIHTFTPDDANDPVLQFLIRNYNSSLYTRQTVPFSMNVNLKATKRLLGDRLMIALFANKLWDAHPDYVRNNFKIRRYVTPYFGLELNVKL